MEAVTNNEKISAKGQLCIKIIRNGKVIEEHADNLIVTQGRNNLAKLLAGQTGMHVTKIGLGTSSVAPEIADTEITDPLLVDISEVRVGKGLAPITGTKTYDDPRVVQFHFNIDIDTAVGMTIFEYGLFCADGTLFSRLVRSAPFEKTAMDAITGFWQIQF